MIIRRKNSGLQRPPLGAQVDWGHRLALGLQACFVFNEQGGAVVTDLFDGAQYPLSGTSPFWRANGGANTPGVNLLATLADNTGATGAAPPRLQISPAVSIIWRGIMTANAETNATIAGLSYTTANTTPFVGYGFGNSGGFIAGWYNSNGTNFRAVGSATLVSSLVKNQELSLALSVKTGSQILYRDGRPDTTTTTAFTTINYSTPSLILGSNAPGVTTLNNQCLHGVFLVYNRIISPAEAFEHSQEPYGFLEVNPARRYFLIGLSSADQGITGSTIATGESFPGGGVVAGPLVGVSPIATAEFFDIGTLDATNSILGGVLSIPSEESFSLGVVAGPVTGVTTIPTAESFPAGLLSYDQAIAAGSTIATAESFGSGSVAFQLSGNTIATAESFGAGSLAFGITGYDAIVTGEYFFPGGLLARERDVALYVRGIDRSSWLQVGSMNVSEELDGGCAATFVIETAGHPARTIYRPSPYDEVIYMFGGYRKFGGFVQDYDETALDGRSDLRIQVTCVDYRQLAYDRVFAKVYTGPTFSSRDIVTEIWEAKLRSENVTWNAGAAENVTVDGDRFTLNGTVSECFDQIATAFGMSWRITRFRELKFERTSWELAPRVLRDNDGHWRNMHVKRSSKLNRTRQGVRTGSAVSGQRQTSITGNGTHEYRLFEPVNGAPTVTVDAVAQAVILWQDRTLYPYDFAYESNSNLLRHNGAQAVLTGANAIEIVHPSETLDVHWVDDTAAIARLAARTGGSGIVEVIRNARSIRDIDSATQLANTELEKKGASAEEITWEEDEYLPSYQHFTGPLQWAVGQIVQCFVSAPLVGGMYVVQALKTQEVGGTFLRHTITATSRELPMIVGVEVDPEDRTVTITVDRPVDLDPGSGITIWGGGGLEPIWGTPAGGGINGSSGTTLTFPLPAEVDPGDLSYYGGIGGVFGGGAGLGPIDSNPLLGTNGLNGGGEPFGGYIFSGIPPTGGPGELAGGGLGIGQPALVVIAVNKGTKEVTVSANHGWSSSGTGTFRVAIFGVSGCDSPSGSTINNPTSRIAVTGATTFTMLDVGDISEAEGFVNDGHGRAISTDQIVRVTPGTGNTALTRLGFGGSIDEQEQARNRATFVLGSAVPGQSSRPLGSGSSVTNPYPVQEQRVVESVTYTPTFPGAAGFFVLDLKQDGVSIFAEPVRFPSTQPATGDEDAQTIRSGFRETPLTVRPGERLTADIVEVDPDNPVCGGVVHLNFK